MNDKPPAPKRGALPTPKAVIDKAPRYNPDQSHPTDNESGDQTSCPPDPRRREDDQGDTGTTDEKEPKPK